MKRNARGVILVDSDKDDVEALRESVHNLSVIDKYDFDLLEREIVLKKRRIVLISADPDPLVAMSMALFATTRRIIRVGVLSATNSLPPHLTDTPFMINGALVFFSNGGGVQIGPFRPQRKKGLRYLRRNRTSHVRSPR